MNPKLYWKALCEDISKSRKVKLKEIIKHYSLDPEASLSQLRGDNGCIIPTHIKYLKDKKYIIEYAEDNSNKYRIAEEYKRLCSEGEYDHPLADLIIKQLGDK